MVREEVHRLQSRVDVLEQVRLEVGLAGAHRSQSPGMWFQTMGWLGILGGRAARMLSFLLCWAALCGIPQADKN